MGWLSDTPKGAVLTVRVVPRSSRTQIAEATDEYLRVRLKAPPVDGKANAELAKFLAKQLGVGKANVAIVAGQTNRLKRVLVKDAAAAAVRAALTSRRSTL